MNPVACARACAERLRELGGPSLRIGVVSGDNVLGQLTEDSHPEVQSNFCHLESKEPLDSVRSRLMTANAYLGADPLIDALRNGADIVITGRVADPSLTVAACVHHFEWADNDWNRWASATVAGHLLECGVQATGGISTDWLDLPDVANIGFPVVEMHDDGSFVVTKGTGTGGRVSVSTVTEQLVYEIGNPGCYLSPDLTVSFLGLKLEQESINRVRVTGAIGSPPSPTYKVSATYRDGFRAAGHLTIFGHDAVRKAQRCGDIVLTRMKAAGYSYRDSIVECIGAGACAMDVVKSIAPAGMKETAFRIAIESDDQQAVEYFTRQMIPLVTSGPQGVTGYAEGRPRVHPIFRYWPCLISREQVQPHIEYIDSKVIEPQSATSNASVATKAPTSTQPILPGDLSTTTSFQIPKRLGDLAYARSGDKGSMANIGIIARNPKDYRQLCQWLTTDRVASYFAPLKIKGVERFEMPNLGAMNFLIHGVLARIIRLDAQGKALGQVLLEMPLDDYPTSGESS